MFLTVVCINCMKVTEVLNTDRDSVSDIYKYYSIIDKVIECCDTPYVVGATTKMTREILAKREDADITIDNSDVERMLAVEYL